MNIKAAHEALLATARNQTTISYSDIIRTVEINTNKMSSDAISGILGHLLYDNLFMQNLRKTPMCQCFLPSQYLKTEVNPQKDFTYSRQI